MEEEGTRETALGVTSPRHSDQDGTTATVVVKDADTDMDSRGLTPPGAPGSPGYHDGGGVTQTRLPPLGPRRCSLRDR